jgi:hypothetical protein
MSANRSGHDHKYEKRPKWIAAEIMEALMSHVVCVGPFINLQI